MKTFLIFWLTVGFLTCSRAATNLVTNGDFETSSLTPWTGSSDTIQTTGTNHSCVIGRNGNLQQSITTTPGTQYFIAADITVSTQNYQLNASLSVQAGAGGATIGSRPANLPYLTSISFTRISFVFTATTANTNVVINGAYDQNYIPGLTTTVDNVVVYEVAPSTLAGRYSGQATLALGLPSPDKATIKAPSPVLARVSPDGSIIIMGVGLRASGVILNDGTLELAGGDRDYKATIKGDRITFPIPNVLPVTYAVTGTDASNTAPALASFPGAEIIVLTRVAK